MIDFESWPNFKKGFTDVCEAELLYNSAMEKQPKMSLEIGRRMGISTRLLALVAKKCSGKVFSVDGLPRKEAERALEKEKLTKYVELINHWSPWVPINPEWDLDLLYIDGDHTFISTVADYHFFNYFLNKDGIVAFHDCLYPPVKEAIRHCVRRDRLEKIGEAGQMVIFKKTMVKKWVYYQFSNQQFDVYI